MVNVWFTADTHFNHDSMVTKGWRPFSSREEMNETLVERWNNVVGPKDQVWHLGDWGMGSDFGHLFFLRRLNGEKHLVTGNHDKPWPGNRDAHKHQARWMRCGFESVQSFARRKVGGKRVLLSHFPYAGDHTEVDRYNEYRLTDTGMWLLHGHVHDEWKYNGRQINVGVDVSDWAPVHLDEIVAHIEENDAAKG